MSDLVGNNSHSFSSANTSKTSITLPKSQPVRLLYLCESDEDDDDNENEEKPCESEDESDLGEIPSDSVDDAWEPRVHEAIVIDPLIDSTDKLSKTIGVSPKNDCAIATNISSIEKNCVNNKDKINSGGCLLVGDSSKLKIYGLQENNLQDYHSSTFTSLKSQIDIRDCSTEVVLPPSSFYKEDYFAKSDMNKNLQPTINSAQSNHENVYVSNTLNKKKEEHLYSTMTDNKMLPRNNEHLLNLSKEDQRNKGVLYNFNEQTNKDCNEEPRKIPSIVSESASCISQNLSGNLINLVTYNNSQCSTSKYEANEKCTPAKNPSIRMELSTPSLNKIQQTSLPTPVNRLVLETPLKQPVGSMHPNPCISHKQLFQTPQSKLCDDLSKSHVQTPSTILSSWCYNNTRHTPMGKNIVTKDHVQIPRNTVCTPIAEKPDSARFVESFYNYFKKQYLTYYLT